MTSSSTRAVTVLALAIGLLFGCASAPPSPEGGAALVQQATAALREMNELDPGVEPMARKGHGYALFPEVSKGGLVFGGAYGRGVVYEQGQHVGYGDLTLGSFGLQVGGQRYRELIVFEDKAALDRFKQGRLAFRADASVVLTATGTAINAPFVDGVAVVVMPIDGAMAEAVVAGQQFTYTAK